MDNRNLLKRTGHLAQLALAGLKAMGTMLCYYVQYKDLLQLMIESTVKDKKLTVEEITGHAITFILAGYETTANALSYVSYLLALNPHVQEKLQEEIDKFYEENEVNNVSRR